MRYALVKDNKVINVIVADESWEHPEFIKILDLNDKAEPGGTWDGEQFLPSPPPLPPEPIPVTQITMRQCRLQLLAVGLLDAVEDIVAQADKSIQIEWEYATIVYKSSPLIESFASQLNLTSEQVDEMFRQALLL